MVSSFAGKDIEIMFPSRIGYERIAMECAASYAKILGFTQERIEDLKTSVSEACLNAIIHGNKERNGSRVTVAMNFENDTLSIFIKDEGAGIQEPPPEPDIEKKIKKLEPPNRLGMFLIRKLMDRVEFNQMISDSGHVVWMAMRLTHSQQGMK